MFLFKIRFKIGCGLLAVWRHSLLINKPFCRRVAVFTFLWFAGFFPVTPLTTFIHLTMLKLPPAIVSSSLLASRQFLLTLRVGAWTTIRLQSALPTSRLIVPPKVCFLTRGHFSPRIAQVSEFRKHLSTFDNVAVNEVLRPILDPVWSWNSLAYETAERCVEFWRKFSV